MDGFTYPSALVVFRCVLIALYTETESRCRYVGAAEFYVDLTPLI